VPTSGKSDIWIVLEDWYVTLGWDGGEKVREDRDLLRDGFCGLSEGLSVEG